MGVLIAVIVLKNLSTAFQSCCVISNFEVKLAQLSKQRHICTLKTLTVGDGPLCIAVIFQEVTTVQNGGHLVVRKSFCFIALLECKLGQGDAISACVGVCPYL